MIPRLRDRLAPVSLLILGCLAYAPTLASRDFIRDDWHIVATNPLLRLRAAPLEVFKTGYWQAVHGSATAAASEYRPVTMLTHWLDLRLFGRWPGPMHAVNILLHGLVYILLWTLLRRVCRISGRVAWLSAAIFAVMPVHAEAVAGLVGRAELLAAAWMMAAWLVLHGDPGPRQIGLGASAYALAALSKEHGMLFPALLAMGDWAFSGQKPWEGRRRKVYAALLAAAALVLAARLAVVGSKLDLGRDYFKDAPLPAGPLTVSRFWVERYLWPSLTGFGLCNDFARPLIPDSGPGDLRAWLCLTALATLWAWTAWALACRRSQAGFWALVPLIFLLPTSHLFARLHVLGAQRFFYMPSVSLAVGMGALLDRLCLLADRHGAPARAAAWAAAALLIAAGLARTASRSLVWTSDLAYYEDEVRSNPASSGPRYGLGLAMRDRGDLAAAARELQEAMRLSPENPLPYFSLGRMAWDAGDRTRAEEYFRKAHERSPRLAPILVALGVAAEYRRDPAAAEGWYRKALEYQPLDSSAAYNLGLLLRGQGRRDEAARWLERFLELDPEDPDAAAVSAMIASPDGRGTPQPRR